MIVLAGYYQVSGDMPNPVWKYPASYLPVHAYAIEVSKRHMLDNEEAITFDLSVHFYGSARLLNVVA